MCKINRFSRERTKLSIQSSKFCHKFSFLTLCLVILSDVCQVEMDDSMKKSCVAVVGNENIDSGNKTCSIISSVQDELPIGDCALGRIQLSSKYLQKLHGALATKENVLTQTALRVLLRKRYKLVLLVLQ